MQPLPNQEAILNIRYDAPDEIWAKISFIYSQMPGWLGFAEDNMPYWYSNDNSGHKKTISASVEPGGLQLYGYMSTDEWSSWLSNFIKTATSELGFEVGDVRDGYE